MQPLQFDLTDHKKKGDQKGKEVVKGGKTHPSRRLSLHERPNKPKWGKQEMTR